MLYDSYMNIKFGEEHFEGPIFVMFWSTLYTVNEVRGGEGEAIKMVPFCIVTSRSLNVCVQASASTEA